MWETRINPKTHDQVFDFGHGVQVVLNTTTNKVYKLKHGEVVSSHSAADYTVEEFNEMLVAIDKQLNK